MELLFCIGVILILGLVLLLMFIGGIISLFSESQTAKKSKQIEVSTVNQFSNESAERSDVIQ
jgi:flagellar basal body-associated protein FliL